MKKRFAFFRIRFSDFVFIVLLLVSGTLLGFSCGGFIINFKTVGFTIFSSVQQAVYVAGNSVKNTVGTVQHIAQLQKENEILTQKLQNYEAFQRDNAQITKENTRLKEQLDYREKLSQKNITAQIIGRDPDNLYSSLTINKGSSAGIKKNMSVIAIQNGKEGLVGKVVSVGLSTSMVMPIYDTKCNVSARIQNTRDLGLVNGAGSSDLPLTLKYIKKRVAQELSYGDLIVTSGENENYLKDMPIGSIEKVAVLEYEATLLISITPVIDFARLENVIVLDLQEAKSL